MHIRCPHCHNPIEAVDADPLTDISCPTCGSNFSLIAGETAPYAPGAVRTIGHFELLESVGDGHFGTVWKARDTKLDRTVAVKIPRRGQIEGPEAEMFVREARAAAQVKHPGVVGVYEVGQEDGTLYIVSDFIDGCNLMEWLSGHQLTPREAAELCMKIAEALDVAHGAGVVHRDLKPSNVMMDMAGQPHLTDFGLAKREVGEITMTVDGQVLGTPAYMSPEQARGEAHMADRRSDVYSLGVILFELLTGEVPFRGNQRMMVVQILQDEPPSPRKLQTRIPRDLETICLKCLEKVPGKRYQTAAELAAELGRFLRSEPIVARPIGRPARLWRWCRRHPALAMLYFVLLFCGLGSTAAALYLNSLLLAKSTAEHLANEKLWESYLAQAQATRLTHQPGQRFRALQAIKAAIELTPPAGRSRSELRTEAIAALCLPDLEVDKEWDGYPKGSSAFAMDANFERYARADKDGNVSVRRVNNDTELLSLPGIGPCADYGGLLFSPCGRFLRVRRQGSYQDFLWRIDVSPPTKVLTLDGQTSCFSPDGGRLAFCKLDGTFHILDMESGRELRRFDVGLPNAFVAWNPTDPQQVLLTSGNSYRILNLETGKLGPRVNVPPFSDVPHWHPDGWRIAFGSRADHNIRLWDAQRGQVLPPLFQGHQTGGVIFSFSQAGDLLLSSDWSTLWRLWDTRTGQQLLSLPADGHTLQFSLEDRRLAAHAGNGKVRLFRIAMGREFATLVPRGWPQRHGYYDLTKAPLNDKGRLLALERADADGIALVDLERLEELAVLPVPGEKSVAFESSGESLLTLGRSGLLRWPLHFSGDDSDRLEIGSPKCIDRLPHKDLSISDDGSVLAVNLPEGALIWRPKENRKLTTAGRQADVRSCAVSPDARWVATGSGELLQGAGAKVWDAATGQLVAELPIGRMCCVWFSPDSKWLVTGGGGFRIWEVGTWREGAKLGGIEAFGMACAFTRDGKLIALGDENPGLVRLVEPDSGREVARLAAPVSSRLLPKCFTPDSGKLVCIGRESQALYVFDLRLIRSGLRELGLAWDLEEGAANEPENKLIRPRKPLAVHFEAAIDSLPFADVGGDIEVARAKPSSPEERESLLKKRLPGIRKVADHAQKASWSPEGDRIVCTKSGDVGLEIVNVSTGVKTDLTAPGKDAAWSPGDGRWIAFVKVSGEHEEVWLVDSTGKQPRKLADGGFPSWSGDGKRLFLQSRRTGKLQVIRFLPEPSPPVDVCSMPCEYPAVSWDGESAAYWDKDLLNIVDLKSGTDKRSYGLPFKALALVGWSPDGKQVGLGPFSRTPGMGLYIVNLETGSVVQAAEGEYTRPAWSRDGLRLAFDRRDNGLEEIWTVETKSLAAMKPFEVKTPTVPKPVPSSAHVDRGGS